MVFLIRYVNYVSVLTRILPEVYVLPVEEILIYLSLEAHEQVTV